MLVQQTPKGPHRLLLRLLVRAKARNGQLFRLIIIRHATKGYALIGCRNKK